MQNISHFILRSRLCLAHIHKTIADDQGYGTSISAGGVLATSLIVAILATLALLLFGQLFSFHIQLCEEERDRNRDRERERKERKE